MLGAPNVVSESHRWLQSCMCSGKIALEIETTTMCTKKYHGRGKEIDDNNNDNDDNS